MGHKPAQIKRSSIIAPIEQGGLAMIDVYAIHSVAKCSWIRRLFDKTNSKWKTTFLNLLNLDYNMLNKNIDLQMAAKCKTDFYQVLWITIHSTEPNSYKEIIIQFFII